MTRCTPMVVRAWVASLALCSSFGVVAEAAEPAGETVWDNGRKTNIESIRAAYKSPTGTFPWGLVVDDFQLTVETRIDAVVTFIYDESVGVLSPSYPDQSYASVGVSFFRDVNGMPGTNADRIVTHGGLPYEVNRIQGVFYGTNGTHPEHTIRLPQPLTLPPGRYWVALWGEGVSQACLTVSTRFCPRFVWGRTQSLAPAVWYLPGSWSAIGAFDMDFKLLGHFLTPPPPTARCRDVVKTADASCLTDVSAAEIDDGSSSPTGEALTLTLSPAGPFPVGTTVVELVVSDGQLESSCQATVTVVGESCDTGELGVCAAGRTCAPGSPGTCARDVDPQPEGSLQSGAWRDVGAAGFFELQKESSEYFSANSCASKFLPANSFYSGVPFLTGPVAGPNGSEGSLLSAGQSETIPMPVPGMHADYVHVLVPGGRCGARSYYITWNYSDGTSASASRGLPHDCSALSNTCDAGSCTFYQGHYGPYGCCDNFYTIRWNNTQPSKGLASVVLRSDCGCSCGDSGGGTQETWGATLQVPVEEYTNLVAASSRNGCDGLDNNCNGQVDEVAGTSCYGAFGECARGTWVCEDGGLVCAQLDTENDSVTDGCDNCPDAFNTDQADQDEDGIGDACDPDADGDGAEDLVDNCLGLPNPDQSDLDGDDTGDLCDLDDDGDGCVDRRDPNPRALDSGADGDGDGVPDVCDTCPSIANANQEDRDVGVQTITLNHQPDATYYFDTTHYIRGGTGDYDVVDGEVVRGGAMVHTNLEIGCGRCLDFDPDAGFNGSGQLDRACSDRMGRNPPLTLCLRAPEDHSVRYEINFVRWGWYNKTFQVALSDGIGDACDNCPDVPSTDLADTDGDGLGDACERDSDDDGCADDVDANPRQVSGDADADLVPDDCDNCRDAANLDQADTDAGLLTVDLGAGGRDYQRYALDDENWIEKGDASWRSGGLTTNMGIGCGACADIDPSADRPTGNLDQCGTGVWRGRALPITFCLVDVDDPEVQYELTFTTWLRSHKVFSVLRTGDGVGDACERCSALLSPDNQDSDGDGAGDACDPDADGDGCSNDDDRDPLVSHGDRDGDSVGDDCDLCADLSAQDNTESDATLTHVRLADYPEGRYPLDSQHWLQRVRTLTSDLGLEWACGACADEPSGWILGQIDAVCGFGSMGNRGPFATVCGRVRDNPGKRWTVTVTRNWRQGGDELDVVQIGDGHADACDNCASVGNPDQADADADGSGDACDNCPSAGNADQIDADGDTRGDACDNCPNLGNVTLPGWNDAGVTGFFQLEKEDGTFFNGNSCASKFLPEDATYAGVPFDTGPQAGPDGSEGSLFSAGETAVLPMPAPHLAVTYVHALVAGGRCGGRSYYITWHYSDGLTASASRYVEHDCSAMGDSCDEGSCTTHLGNYGPYGCCDNFYVIRWSNTRPDVDVTSVEMRADCGCDCGGSGGSTQETWGVTVEVPAAAYFTLAAGRNQADGDGDGRGDACDNCLGAPNLDQADSDGDALGDACDCEQDGSCTAPYGCETLGVPDTDCDSDCYLSSDPEFCDDANPCTDDVCEHYEGCVSIDNAVPCDDGEVCTTDDQCVLGSCAGGPPPVCDDGNACTDDACVAGEGCGSAANVAACNDGNPCTVSDVCSGGACSGAARSCSDGNPCTDDTCDPASGCASNNNHAQCSDGNTCTGPDTCSAGACAPGPQICDGDGDGVVDPNDNCPSTPNASQLDSDDDGRGDACESCPHDAEDDIDADGVCGDTDNCPVIGNAGQADNEHDGIGDVCDSDDDNDGVSDGADACPRDSTQGLDADHDGCADTAAGLAELIAELGLDPALAQHLGQQTQVIASMIASGQRTAAKGKLNAFIQQVAAQRGKKLTAQQADALIAFARSVLAGL